MKKQLEDKTESAKKLMHAIGELPEDMISKANPENWKNGIYIGKDDLEAADDTKTERSRLSEIFRWTLKKRKMVAFAATMFLCVIVAGVWKINSLDEHIKEKVNNEQSDDIVWDTSEPESTYEPLQGTGKKHKKSSKNKVKKDNKKNNKGENRKTTKKNDKPKDEESVPDNTPVPGIGQYSDDNDEDTNRRGIGTGDDNNEDTDDKSDVKEESTESPQVGTDPDASGDDNVSDENISVTAYKIDEAGNRSAVNISSADALRLTLIIDGKKYLADADSDGYAAVIRYKGSDYYYDSDSKMLIISGKSAKLSDSENAELKKILKLD